MKLNKLALLLLIQPVIYGCSDDEQLDCNADSNKETALHIIHRALTNTYNNPKIETVFNDGRIENIKTRSVDAVGSLTCGATYSFSYDGTVYSKEFDYDLTWLQDKKTTEVSLDPSHILKYAAVAYGKAEYKRYLVEEAEKSKAIAAAQIVVEKVEKCISDKKDALYKEMGDIEAVTYIVAHEYELNEQCHLEANKETQSVSEETECVSCTVEDRIDNAPPLTEGQKQCADEKMADYRKVAGADAIIAFDQIGEWEEQCRKEG
ncbi:hypothetical protein [Aeromonas caviae]|uniref:hypothetical protein n=1 Tax=Aeromonas caviae TaxID=648 RepID=UPI002B4945D2|nr:hypothetical protein [Aeromonas caviae]